MALKPDQSIVYCIVGARGAATVVSCRALHMVWTVEVGEGTFTLQIGETPVRIVASMSCGVYHGGVFFSPKAWTTCFFHLTPLSLLSHVTSAYGSMPVWTVSSIDCVVWGGDSLAYLAPQFSCDVVAFPMQCEITVSPLSLES